MFSAPPASRLFPYTTLFRSAGDGDRARDRELVVEEAAALCEHRHDGSTAQARQAKRPLRHAERSEEHTSELQSRLHLVCRLLLEKKNKSNGLTDTVTGEVDT